MRPARSWRAVRRLLGGVLACVLVSACGVGMPEHGPVREAAPAGVAAEDNSVIINPLRPIKGESPDRIVHGFLDAMTATPVVTTSVAREFLTREAAASWQPTGMLIYGGMSSPRGTTEVEVRFADVDRIDSRGAWLGPVPPAETVIGFEMSLEDGEWRIASPPPQLIVPESWFTQRFRQVSLYFFNPSATLLIPEPVFVPRGQQFASSLVNALLQGPADELTAVEQSYVPPDLRPMVSVPVSGDGVARIDLTSDTGEARAPGPEQAELLVAQLAWTLRQDPAIARFQVTIDGRQVQLAGESEFSVAFGSRFAPYATGSGGRMVGLRAGRMVRGAPDALNPVGGPFGAEALAPRSIAADFDGERVAAVSADGTTLSVAPTNHSDVRVRPLLSDAENLLRPAWDLAGRLWAVDRRGDGAVVSYLHRRGMRTLDVPGMSGLDVKDFLISPDGSRLVAVVRENAGNDRIVVSRIVTTGTGGVARALPAGPMTDPSRVHGAIRAIAWRSPTSVVVMHPVNRRLYQFRSASVDGAVGPDPLFLTINESVRALIGNATVGFDTYILTTTDSGTASLVNLAGPHAERIGIDPEVTMLAYPG